MQKLACVFKNLGNFSPRARKNKDLTGQVGMRSSKGMANSEISIKAKVEDMVKEVRVEVRRLTWKADVAQPGAGAKGARKSVASSQGVYRGEGLRRLEGRMEKPTWLLAERLGWSTGK